MAVTKIKPVKSTLNKALDYNIQSPDKTDEKMLVSSFGCSYETADIKEAFTPGIISWFACARIIMMYLSWVSLLHLTWEILFCIVKVQRCIFHSL